MMSASSERDWGVAWPRRAMVVRRWVMSDKWTTDSLAAKWRISQRS